MDQQNVYLELDRYHDLIHTDKSHRDIMDLYHNLVLEEFEEYQCAATMANKIKEAIDLLVVTRPIIRLSNSTLDRDGNYAMTEAVKGWLRAKDVNWCVALHRVNESNMSKFFAPSEIGAATDFFESKGIIVDIERLDIDVFGAFSQLDQHVNGKFFKAGKGLKGPYYKAIDESSEWWKV